MVAAKNFRRAEAELIYILQELEESRAFLEFKLTSLFQYAVKIMRLSEDVAANFVTISRKAKQVPMLQAAIRDGSVSVSKARKINSVLTPDNQEKWIEKVKTLPYKELEREVAKANPQAAAPERTKYVSDDRIELRMGISQSMFEDLKRAQDLESKRTAKSASLEETLQVLLKVYLEVKDPQKRATRILSVARRANPTNHSSKAIPSMLKYEVASRDKGKCTFQGCENRRWTEVHHIKPRCDGGDHSLENLTTLCSVHHKEIHRMSV